MGDLFRSIESVDENLTKVSPDIFKPEEYTVETKIKGKHKGDGDLSPELRTLIALTSLDIGVTKAARTFNVAESTVSQLAQGRISNPKHGRIDEGLKARVETKKEEINSVAVDLLLEGLKSVSVAEVSSLDVTERIKALKDVSQIVEKTSSNGEKNQGGNNYFFMAPQMVNVEKFEVLVPE